MKNYKKLQTYLSNLAVLNAKLHNIHWNVEGKQFMQVHKFTEELYEDFFEKMDVIAEILKMKEEKPLVKMNDYVENATVKELSAKSFSCEEALKLVEDDLKEMKDLAIKIREEADFSDDFEIVAEMEDHVAEYSQKLWFLRAMQK